MWGGGSKAQKDKPEGPSHTPGLGWACPCSPPSQGRLLKPLSTVPNLPLGEEGTWGGGGSYFLWCVTKLFPSCLTGGGVPNCNSRRPKQ